MNRLQENNEVQSMINYIKEVACLHDTLFLDIQKRFLLAIQSEKEAKRLCGEAELLIILIALESKISVEQFISRYTNTYPTICILFQKVRNSASMISALRDALLITFSQLSNMLKEMSNEKENKKKAI